MKHDGAMYCLRMPGQYSSMNSSSDTAINVIQINYYNFVIVLHITQVFQVEDEE